MRMLLGSLLLAAALPASADSGALVRAIEDAAREDGVHGAVRIVDGGRLVHEGGYGYADREWSVPNAGDTRYRIASLTKQFLAILLLQEAERGRLDLQATLDRYLPDYAAPWAGQVSIHQLLVHTAGVPDFVSLDWDAYTRRYLHVRVPAEDIAADLATQALEFAPGARFAYSNSGYLLLGLVLEAVTGASWCALLKERILDPAGMADSGCDDFETVRPRRARGYYLRSEQYSNAPYDHSAHAEGNMYATVRDLERYDRALREGRLLSPPMQALMHLPHVRVRAEEGERERWYGYGVYLQRRSDEEGGEVTVATHSGGIEGFSAFLLRGLEDGRFVALLENVTRDGERVDVVHALYPPVAAPAAP
ncbi:MAG: serine hydrolase domain-containing protein [Pseudomonadales bacterium]|nr:serine hydrolase domain-containing protein [Pseudomonadales bacterium]